MALGVGLAVAFAAPAAPVPVIYSTDLFHPHQDPDDHFDLACMYSMAEVNLLGIVLDQGDEQAVRPGFPPVRQLNYLAGRNVPTAVGLRDKLASPEDIAIGQPARFQEGVNFILSNLERAQGKVTIIFVGSARDTAAAYNRRPELFRAKVEKVVGFIGDAGEPEHREWNVGLDPQAFVCLMRSEVPFYWVPCFDGGVWQNHGRASFWQASHHDLLGNAPAPLQNYFLYMLRKSTEDPIEALGKPLTGTDLDWGTWGQRNMWCGAVLGLVLGRPLPHEGRDVARFTPVEITIDAEAVVHYGKAPGSRTVMQFQLTDPTHFADVATLATADLLRNFPLQFRE